MYKKRLIILCSALALFVTIFTAALWLRITVDITHVVNESNENPVCNLIRTHETTQRDIKKLLESNEWLIYENQSSQNDPIGYSIEYAIWYGRCDLIEPLLAAQKAFDSDALLRFVSEAARKRLIKCIRILYEVSPKGMNKVEYRERVRDIANGIGIEIE